MLRLPKKQNKPHKPKQSFGKHGKYQIIIKYWTFFNISSLKLVIKA